MTMRLERLADGSSRHVPTPMAPPAPKSRKKRVPPDPMKTGGDSAAKSLRLLIERVERLEEEKQGIADDIKDVYAEAKSTGHDVKTMREIVRLRKMEKHHRDEADMLIETYRVSLGV
jgi:uncharacterized protein (UPF0335 family)